VLTAEASDWGGAEGSPDPDFDVVDVLDVAEDGEAVDLPTVDGELAVVGALAVAGVLVATDVGLAEMVVGGSDLLAAMGATVELLLICMIACL
jgi:hypothetical protein